MHRFPAHGLAGLAILGGTCVLRAAGVRLAALFWTPLLWTGYILAIDAWVYRRRGRSWLVNERGSFAWAALLSIPLWLVFEAYNLRLRNWEYVGLPESMILRQIGFLWSFATIWPAVLETADLLLAFGLDARGRATRLPGRGLMAIGLGGLVVPLAVPAGWGGYLFGLVWLGFALLMDPLNEQAGRSSLVGDLAVGRWGRLWSLLASGLICGFLWESWNMLAEARWVYTFPIMQQAKIFEMPLPGFLGFPAFALEIFAMYVWLCSKLHIKYYEVI